LLCPAWFLRALFKFNALAGHKRVTAYDIINVDEILFLIRDILEEAVTANAETKNYACMLHGKSPGFKFSLLLRRESRGYKQKCPHQSKETVRAKVKIKIRSANPWSRSTSTNG